MRAILLALLLAAPFMVQRCNRQPVTRSGKGRAVAAAVAAPSPCPTPAPGEVWDRYNHPDWYITRTGTVTLVEPCYVTLHFPEGDSVRFLAGNVLQSVPLSLGATTSTSYRLTTTQMAYYTTGPLPSPSPTPSPEPTLTPSPTPIPSPGVPTPTPLPSPTPTPSPCNVAALTSPIQGSTISSQALFAWTTPAWELDIGTTLGGSNIFTSAVWNYMVPQQIVSNLPMGTIYARLYTICGQTYPTRDYVFTVAPSPTPTPVPTPTPTPTPTPKPSPSPSPSPSPTPAFCKPDQLRSTGCICRTQWIGNPQRCKP